MDTLTKDRLEREFKVTERALQNADILLSKDSQYYKVAQKIVDTAQRYYDDARFFEKKGDKASAFGALNYAFGWLDCGREAGFLKPGEYK